MIINYIFQDWQANQDNLKGRLVLLHFRLAHLCQKVHKPFYYLFLPYLIYYQIVFEWILGIELPKKTQIGTGLKLYHGQALVVNCHSIIGDNCTLRHSTTIGNKGFDLNNKEDSDSPKIGNNVDIGSNVVIIGTIEIGDNVKIGAGSVVVKSLEANGIYAGNPAKLVKKII
jgi:putative colanic acid biosynthesis acetyltransferase WcaB